MTHLKNSCSTLRSHLSRRPELLVFAVILIVFNFPVRSGSFSYRLVFLPDAVAQGEWWRLITHPFVHVSWYHLLLDGTALVMLYQSLIEPRLLRRMAYVWGGAVGGLLFSWLAAPAINAQGLCGLSAIAHGLMAVSSLEMVSTNPKGSVERRLGWISFGLVIGKAMLEALTGRMFFTFLHFGLMGHPVAVSHAGGIIGSLLAMLLLHSKRNKILPRRQDIRRPLVQTESVSHP